MVQHFEATIEDGVLKPDEPLRFSNRQRVRVTATDEVGSVGGSFLEPEPPAHRKLELEWIRQHEQDYRGMWLALDGSTLLASGPDARAVREEARSKGVAVPYLHRVPPSRK